MKDTPKFTAFPEHKYSIPLPDYYKKSDGTPVDYVDITDAVEYFDSHRWRMNYPKPKGLRGIIEPIRVWLVGIRWRLRLRGTK